MNGDPQRISQDLLIGIDDEYSTSYVDYRYSKYDHMYYDDNVHEETSDLIDSTYYPSYNSPIHPLIFTSNMYHLFSPYEDGDDYIDSTGNAFFNFHPDMETVDFKVFLEGMSYVEGDDVEVIDIHLGNQNDHGPSVLSLCNEVKGKGHCREGPGLSVEGSLYVKDLKGPLKNSSFGELIRLIEGGNAYLNVQSRDHPESEISGQIFSYQN